MRIGAGGPQGHGIEQQKNQQPSEKASEEIEGAGPDAHGKKEELPLCPENREGPRERAMNHIDAARVHGCPSKGAALGRKEPGEEVDGGDGHTDAEKHASENTL